MNPYQSIFITLKKEDRNTLRAVAHLEKFDAPINDSLRQRAASLLSLGLVHEVEADLRVLVNVKFAALAYGEAL